MTLPGASIRRVCRVLKFSRARLRARAVIAKVAVPLDEVLAGRIRRLIELYPTFGYRRLWALLRFGEGMRVNRKAVDRILKLKRWFVHQRVATPRPRVQGRRSRAQRSDERWARNSLRLIHPSRTASSNASFAASKKSASDSITSAASPKPAQLSLTGSNGITPNGPHQALGYRSPRQFRALQPQLVA